MTGVPGKGGQKGRSGRRKSPRGEAKAATSNFERATPEMSEILLEIARGGPIICQKCGADTGFHLRDLQATIESLNRGLGKAKQHVEIGAKLTLTASEIRTLDEIGEQSKQNFIEGKIPELLEANP